MTKTITEKYDASGKLIERKIEERYDECYPNYPYYPTYPYPTYQYPWGTHTIITSKTGGYDVTV